MADDRRSRQRRAAAPGASRQQRPHGGDPGAWRGPDGVSRRTAVKGGSAQPDRGSCVLDDELTRSRRLCLLRLTSIAPFLLLIRVLRDLRAPGTPLSAAAATITPMR